MNRGPGCTLLSILNPDKSVCVCVCVSVRSGPRVTDVGGPMVQGALLCGSEC